MLIVGPTFIMLMFFAAFILWIKFMTQGHEIRVVKEEQLYNRYLEELKLKREAHTKPEFPQRDPVEKETRYIQRSTEPTHTSTDTEDTRRDSGIV
jgi:hypothetical protein